MRPAKRLDAPNLMRQAKSVKISFRKIKLLKKRVVASLSGRRNVHFLHVRKAGGTALKHVLGPHQVTPTCMLYLHQHRISLKHVPRGHQVMFVTRDPVARYVSGFDSRLRQGAPSRHAPWRGDEEWAFSQFPDPNSLALALDPAHPAHQNALRAMHGITHIRYGYWDWFGDEAALEARREDILFIGRLETFNADFEELKKPLGLPENLTLPSDPKRANRNQSSDTPALEPEAVKWIRHWYRRDYDFLDFCAQWRDEQQGPVAKSALG
ncbi:MAG: hypothetical protein RLZZ214_2050 [Verrucomicrobiota bacterium]|jgi:hypothetical protein